MKNDTTDNRLLDAALAYGKRGWPVFPLHTPTGKGCSCGEPGCRHIGKHPRTKHGHKDATTDESQIRMWWASWPDANIGIATGRKSGIAVLDIDGDVGNQSLEKLESRHGVLPETRTSKSGKGRHLYYAHPRTRVRNSARLLGPGLDVRADGGYIIVPPSVHKNGNTYSWERECELAQMPDWLVRIVVSPKSEQKQDKRTKEIPEGKRNDEITRLAGKMRWSGMTPEEIESALQQINRTRCRPLLSEQEVRKIAESVSHYPAGAGKAESPTSAATERIGQYAIERGRICLVKNLKHGPLSVPLCNFVARVAEELVMDDGQNTARAFVVEAQLDSGIPLPTIRVPSARFGSLCWVPEHWGIDAVVRSGFSTRDQLREAIQLFSIGARRRRIFTDTGWTRIDGQWVYLSAKGALGCPGVEVDLGGGPERYQLPAQPEDPGGATRASLNLWDLAPLLATVPLWAGAFRASLAPALPIDLSLWLEGQTGALKSSLAALFLSHFGHFERTTLPGSWTSTANHLERRAFMLKDTIYVIDDYAPGAQDSRELELKAARLLRAQGNLQSRGRLRADLSERPEFPPRGLILATGEQHPPGQSLLARTPIILIERKDIDMAALTEAQKAATRLPHAMAGYILWLLPQMGGLSSVLRTTFEKTRLDPAVNNEHLRIPEALSHLWVGVNSGLEFAEDVKACSHREAEERRAKAWDALLDLGRAQGRLVEAERPSRRFLIVLQTLLAQGKALLLDKGCSNHEATIETSLVGWYDSDYLFLIPEAAFQVVARFSRESGEGFPVRQPRLCKDLREEQISECDPTRTTTTVRVGSETRRVLKLRRTAIERFLGIEYPVRITEITAITGEER